VNALSIWLEKSTHNPLKMELINLGLNAVILFVLYKLHKKMVGGSLISNEDLINLASNDKRTNP